MHKSHNNDLQYPNSSQHTQPLTTITSRLVNVGTLTTKHPFTTKRIVEPKVVESTETVLLGQIMLDIITLELQSLITDSFTGRHVCKLWYLQDNYVVKSFLGVAGEV